MEVTPTAKPVKQLHKHAAPVVMIIAALTVLSTMTAIGSGGLSRQTETLALRGLTTRVIHVRPDPNGLAEITLGNSDTVPPNRAAGIELGGTSQAGQAAQLSLKLGTH